jgi:D-3-phosphoglycerate dehydrogenase / 2-oxoglutarate reductase
VIVDPAGSKRPTVVLTDHPWLELDVETEAFQAVDFELVAGPVRASPPGEIEAMVRDSDPVAIMTCWAQVNEAAIGAPSDLRIVARLGVGLDNIAVEAATRRGAFVTNVPDYCVAEVSDHAVGLLLAHFRGIVALDREAKAGRWNPEGVTLQRLSALTFGIVGLGRIGRETARKLAALGCRVIAVTRSETEMPPDMVRVSLDQLREQADAIVLHVPLTGETAGMVDDAFIDACRRRPFLVNVSRGGLVDNDALVRGLDAGKLSGAALDVIEGEPSPPLAIMTRPDVIVTPHIAFLSVQSLIELRRRACEEVIRVVRGQPPHHPCNTPHRDSRDA